jgi:hypothetical protein
MDKMQAYALANPLATADPSASDQEFRIVRMPWSIILTVNK